MIQESKTIGLRAGVTALLLLACLCFGGSASVILYEMGLSILALVCFLVAVWFCSPTKVGGPIRSYILAFLSLVAIQLMPLPNLVWNGMPQGQFAGSLLPNAQLRGMWQSLSIAPDETLYSLIAAAPALITFWLVVSLGRSDQRLIAMILIIAVLCQALIGIAQVRGTLAFSMYKVHHPNVAIGLFASRNHFADLILMGTALMFWVRQGLSEMHKNVVSEIVFNAFLILLFIAMIGSSSRAGLVLFVILVVNCYALSMRKKHRIVFVVVGTVLTATLWVNLKLIPATGIVKTTLARFEIKDDGRWDIWDNGWVTVGSYWPWGAGLGGFRQAYQQSESIRSITPPYVNAAHNEYLQIIIENGLIGTLMVTAFIFVIAVRCWRKRGNVTERFISLGLAIIMVHSCIDYPLRVIGLNVFVAFFMGLLLLPDRRNRPIVTAAYGP